MGRGGLPADVLYLGTQGEVEEDLTARAGIPFAAVESGKFRGKTPWTAAASLLKAARGAGQAREIIGRFRPDVVLSTGGYASVPPLLAARRAGVPAMIYLPDIEPGLAIKWMSRLVARVAVSFDEARRYFPAGKAVMTGYPVRSGLHGRDKAEARLRLALPNDEKLLLAFGGSQGSRSINRAVAASLPRLLSTCRVLHLTGHLDHGWMVDSGCRLTEEQRGRYRTHAYLHEEMNDALAAADLVVARAGASTLGEFPAVGLPSLLVPYPYSGQHQAVNARFMERHGAAVMIPDSQLGERLTAEVERILGDEALRRRMSDSARGLARPYAAKRLVEELRRLAGEEKN